MNVRWLRTTLAAASAAMLSACSPTASDTRLASLVFCSEGNPESFNPQLATSGTTFDATARTVYDALVRFNSETVTVDPSLARSWDNLDQGKRWRFQLRDDVWFHRSEAFQPSRPFNADDVVFSFKRQLDANHPFHNIGGGTYPYFQITGLSDKLLDVRVIDHYTVEFLLREKEPRFLEMLSMEFASILSAEYADWLTARQRPEQIDQHPIGTGPFQFVSYRPNRDIRFKRFDHYFLGAAKLKDLIFAITPNTSLRLSRLRAGECDVMAQPSPAQHQFIRQIPELRLIQQRGLNISYWAFNTQKPPFQDVRVRQAFNFAINRQPIIDTVYFSSAELAVSPVPPSLLPHEQQIPIYRFDPSYARELLQQANFPFERTIEIWAMPVSRPYNPNARKMAELIQEDLRHIGVKARIVSYEWREFLRRVSLGEAQSVLMGWSADLPSPDNFLSPLLSCAAMQVGSNRAFWCDQEFDALLQRALEVNDPTTRQQIYLDALRVFKHQAPWLTIAHGSQSIATRANVKFVDLNFSGGVNFLRTEKSL